MKTTVEALEGFQKKLTVTFDEKEIDERIAKQYKDFAYKYNFPGFRKGKAPRPVIDNVLGPQAVVATVTDDILNNELPLAVDANNLIPIGQASFEDTEALVEKGKPFTFSVTIPTRPEFELSNYDAVSIKLPSTEATDEEIQEQVDELRNYYFDFKDCSAATKIKEHSFCDISMEAVDADGNALDSFKTESRLYEVGSGLFPAAFDEALTGMKKGEEKTFEVDMSEPSMMGQGLDLEKVTFTVGIKQVKERVLPELTDEWAKEKAGFESVEELRTRIAENIKVQKEQMMPRLRESETLLTLSERLQDSAPDNMYDDEQGQLMSSFFMQMQQAQMPLDMYLAQMGMTIEGFRDDIKRQARDNVNADLALDAWARHAGIEVSDEDITAEFERAGSDDPKALEESWRSNGRISEIRAGIARGKALEQILEGLQVETLAPGEKLPERKPKDAEATEEGKKPAKKSAAKKSADKGEAADAEADKAAKKPAAKKAAAKKDEADADEKPAKKASSKKAAAADAKADEAEEAK